MNKQKIAKELVNLARELVGKKGEVPEAFKKQWKKNDKGGDKEKDDKPDFLKKKDGSSRTRLTARTKTAADFPYATLIFSKGWVGFRIRFSLDVDKSLSGTEPYRGNVPRAIAKVLKLMKMRKVPDENIEVIE